MKPIETTKNYLTTNELCKELGGKSKNLIYLYRISGKIKKTDFVKIKGMYYYSRNVLNYLVREK